jgi:hypothetical protein
MIVALRGENRLNFAHRFVSLPIGIGDVSHLTSCPRESAVRYEIRELNIGGILDSAIAVAKDNLWLLVKIVSVLFIPFALASNWIIVSTGAALQAHEAGGFVASAAVLQIVNGLLVYPLTNAAVIYAIASCYLTRPISVGIAFRRARGVYFRLLGTMILFGFAVGLAIMVLAILLIAVTPRLLGVMVALTLTALLLVYVLRYLLTFQIVVLEGLWGPSAFRRSRQLMRGNMGTAMLLGLLVVIIGGALGAMQALIPQIHVRWVVASLLQGITFIFGAAAWVILYFSCRVKAEHFDLALLADAVGADDDQSAPILDVSAGETG